MAPASLSVNQLVLLVDFLYMLKIMGAWCEYVEKLCTICAFGNLKLEFFLIFPEPLLPISPVKPHKISASTAKIFERNHLHHLFNFFLFVSMTFYTFLYFL